jgi:TPR repeat protein
MRFVVYLAFFTLCSCVFLEEGGAVAKKTGPSLDELDPEAKKAMLAQQREVKRQALKDENEQVFSKDVEQQRKEYMRSLGDGQGNEQHVKLDELQDFTQVRRKITQEQHDFLVKEAIQGDADAAYDLGIVFKYGFYGKGRDIQKARSWFLRASKQGNLQAHRQLHYLKLHY